MSLDLVSRVSAITVLSGKTSYLPCSNSDGSSPQGHNRDVGTKNHRANKGDAIRGWGKEVANIKPAWEQTGEAKKRKPKRK